ncbi:glycosyltransferase family 2 protein [Clostridium perfringens]|uniref:glycosyltransferase family 2 protein n=1 Tax=Clostridium perfringens TaxID=1502 RepID=UPI0024BC10E0|nr:glycosyltransferase family 2 protein [Clostridium perfringens]
MSKISIIVPLYNSEKYLDKCIKSILNQTFKNFELILVNDGSKDKSLEICNKYEKKDSRITVINKENEGSIIARRRGVEISKSQYITFIDSDDWIKANTIEILVNEINYSASDVIVFNMYKVLDSLGIVKKENDNRYFIKKYYKGDEIREELASAYLHGHPFPAGLCGKVYKREILCECGKYLDKISFLGDDLFYNLEIFLKVKKVAMINEPLYYYRAGGNTSNYMSYLFNDMINGYRIQKEVIQEYYQDSKQQRYNGISIMLLNTFKTCLSNIFLSSLDELEIKNKINEYLLDEDLLEALKNEGTIRYFDKDFLNAINNKDIDYLYELGKKGYKKSKFRRLAVKILSNL